MAMCCISAMGIRMENTAQKIEIKKIMGINQMMAFDAMMTFALAVAGNVKLIGKVPI